MVFSMEYQSTRDSAVRVSSAQAITQGISREGGLFVPATLPVLSAGDFRSLLNRSYVERANAVLSRFLTDFTGEEIASCTEAAYTAEKFGSDDAAPLHSLDDHTHILELWHGPTCAFKDMALQILPHLMRVSAGKTADGKEIVILVATSGDTGKAALEGFRDAAHTRILVFYPDQGVSPMQKLQMVTQEGNNVAVCAIRGNFDDAQNGVKRIFTDPGVARRLADQGMMFSSANSINWGRLVPQVVYYVSAYCDLLASGRLREGQGFHIVVPTGNFGNILAAYYAKQMGVPVSRLICASNRNRVLADFLETGVYDRRREFHATTSPSMDILISSNLERLLYHLSGRDDGLVRDLMARLGREGVYTVPEEMKAKLQTDFTGGWCDDGQTAATIASVWRTHRYLCDTHTAVAVKVCGEYRRRTGDATPCVIASTANPYKFSSSVASALGMDVEGLDEFRKVEELHRVTGCPVPAPLAAIRGKAVRFAQACEREDMEQMVYRLLHIQE